MFPTEPFTPGHEFVGHVVEMGSAVTGFSVDDLVAVGVGIFPAGVVCVAIAGGHRTRSFAKIVNRIRER